MSWRSVSAVALGLIFAAAAVYWFTIGRRPLEPAADQPEPAAEVVG